MKKLIKHLKCLFLGLPEHETFPLSDVWGYASQHGDIIADAAQIDQVFRSDEKPSEQEASWKSSPCYPKPYLANLKDIVILPGSSVLLDSSGVAHSDEISLAAARFGLPPKLLNMKVIEGPALCVEAKPQTTENIPCGIHLLKEHEANYFHWVVEVLPRLFVCEMLAVDHKVPILVSSDLHPNLYDLLDRIRDPRREVITLSKSKRYNVQNLTYPSDLSRILDVYDQPPTTETTYLPVALLKDMAQSVKKSAKLPPGESKRRIFLKRASSYRRLLNENAIEVKVGELGFEVVDLASASIDDQIKLFSEADIVVGPSGAGMTNILWCEPSTRFLILHPDHPYKKYPYWDALGRISGSRIYYLAGPRAFKETGHYEVHDDYSIDPRLLVNRIETLLDQSSEQNSLS